MLPTLTKSVLVCSNANLDYFPYGLRYHCINLLNCGLHDCLLVNFDAVLKSCRCLRFSVGLIGGFQIILKALSSKHIFEKSDVNYVILYLS